MKMMVGSAEKAKTKALSGPNALPSSCGLASGPNTNCDPASVNCRKRLTPAATAVKKS